MKRTAIGTWMVIGTAACLVGCVPGSEEGSAKKISGSGTCPVEAGSSEASAVCPVPGAQAGGGAVQEVPSISGTVVQTIKAGRYLYVEISPTQPSQTGTVWVAAVADSLEKGQEVSFSACILMKGFESPSLKRRFDSVYFAGSMNGGARSVALPAGHPAVGATAPHGEQGTNTPSAGMRGRRLRSIPADVKVDVAPAPGGVTVEEIFTGLDKLAGTDVLLRGKVTKFTGGIMGENWLRVRDSSGQRDLVVTTKETARAGDVVVVRGRLERDVDLGHGYTYEAIVRGASVTADGATQP